MSSNGESWSISEDELQESALHQILANMNVGIGKLVYAVAKTNYDPDDELFRACQDFMEALGAFEDRMAKGEKNK